MRLILTLVATTAVTGLSSQSSSHGLWSRVPALPTSCYSKDESFDQDAERLRVELDAAILRQEEVNQASIARLATMDFPAATRILESRVVGRRKTMDQELKRIQDRYVADAAPLTPLFTRYRDASALSAGSRMNAKVPEFAAAYDAAYEKFCGKWWSATSPYVAWLDDLKRMLTDAAIPAEDDLVRSRKLQLDVMGIPATEFKSPAEMKAVKEYVAAARKIYQQRPDMPLKEKTINRQPAPVEER